MRLERWGVAGGGGRRERLREFKRSGVSKVIRTPVNKLVESERLVEGEACEKISKI